MRKLFVFLKPHWKAAVLSPLFMVLEVSMDVLQPKYMARIVNQGVMQRNLHTIMAVGAVMTGIAVIGLIGGVACNMFASVVSQNFGADVREALFARVQTFSFRNLDRFRSGSLITRMTNDVVQVQTLVQMSQQGFIRAPGLAIGSIIMALTISTRLGLILLFSVPAMALFLYIIIRISYPLFSVVQARLDRMNTVVQENLAGVRVVKAFVRSRYETSRFAVANEDYTSTAIRAARVIAFNVPILNFVMNVSVVAVLWFGGHQVWNGQLNIGDLMAFINYVTQILSSMMMVSMMLMTISQAKASADRINQVLETQPDIASPVAPAVSSTQRGRVEFRDVSFSYGQGAEQQLVLRHISFTADPGETVAIIGSTGAGKSSLVNLIPRLYDVTDGGVCIDGVDVREIDLARLRAQVGMVLQDSILFSGSIRENICFGRADAGQDDVEKVARAAQAHDFIMALPDGYNTRVGQRGVNLSGGQKQRLAIARALLIRPPILVFDDSTSALDMRTEANLRAALRDLVKDSTTFLIAQRISSVVEADRILVLDEGHIVDIGTHRELMQSSAVYQDICASQLAQAAVRHE